MSDDYTDRILKFVSDSRYRPQKVRALARSMGVAQAEYAQFRDAVKALMKTGRIVLGSIELTSPHVNLTKPRNRRLNLEEVLGLGGPGGDGPSPLIAFSDVKITDVASWKTAVEARDQSGGLIDMVSDDEIAGSIRRLRRGITVDEDALAVDVIASAMDGSRNFLAEMHTVRYLRAGEVLVTHLAERRDWHSWDHAGREEMADRAQARAEHLLAEHDVSPLAGDQERALDEIMQAAASGLVAS